MDATLERDKDWLSIIYKNEKDYVFGNMLY